MFIIIDIAFLIFALIIFLYLAYNIIRQTIPIIIYFTIILGLLYLTYIYIVSREITVSQITKLLNFTDYKLYYPDNFTLYYYPENILTYTKNYFTRKDEDLL